MTTQTNNPQGATAAQALQAMRDARPLVHNITNYVVMNFTANVLLSAGASPIMAHAPEEMEELVAICSSLVINIGTLSAPWVDSMVLAGKTAAKLNKPVVLDPVGAGASKLRTDSAWRIIKEAGVSVIRGNASEIMALQMADATTRGVDSSHEVSEAKDIAQSLAKNLGATVAVTGAQDLVTDGYTTLSVDNGHELMSMVTGTGCAASSIIGAFVGSISDTLSATASGLAYFGVAGQWAATQAQLPGSFMIQFIDGLHQVSPAMVQDQALIAAVE